MDKVHIVIAGRQNVGKSSLINSITSDKRAIVSPIPGTTTDPVRKIYEIPGYATVIFIDTAGIDDCTVLGSQRIEKSIATIKEADVALLLFAHNQFGKFEQELIQHFRTLKMPYLLIHTHRDQEILNSKLARHLKQEYGKEVIDFSIFTDNTAHLIKEIKKIVPIRATQSLLGNIVKQGDIILLVTPIDSEAPTGRLILPQVKTIRDILDNRAVAITLQLDELTPFLSQHAITPALIITDSQVFKQVAMQIPDTIALTSFSILLAQAKGNFDYYRKSVTAIDTLRDNDRILVLESCSHHHSCEDIGRVKIPRMLQHFTGKQLLFDVVSALTPIEEPLEQYALVIQCGGCMVTTTQLQRRIEPFIDRSIPVSNYGMVIAYSQGIFNRVIAPFIR